MTLSGIAALLIGTGILLGAFGAHGLEDQVSPERLETWRTASSYHLFNSMGLLFLTSVPFQKEIPPPIPWMVLFGTALFSGSLYLLVLLDQPLLGAITPLGGLALSTAWIWLGFHLLSAKKSGTSQPMQ